MKCFLNTLIALLPLVAAAQSKPTPPATFVVQGNVPTSTAPKAYLGYKIGSHYHIDSVVVRQGHFQFRGVVPGQPQASIFLPPAGVPHNKIGSDNAKVVYLEKGTITVTGAGSLARARVTGTPLNEENSRLTAQIQPIEDQMAALRTSYDAKPAAEQDSPAAVADYQAHFQDYTASAGRFTLPSLRPILRTP